MQSAARTLDDFLDGPRPFSSRGYLPLHRTRLRVEQSKKRAQENARAGNIFFQAYSFQFTQGEEREPLIIGPPAARSKLSLASRMKRRGVRADGIGMHEIQNPPVRWTMQLNRGNALDVRRRGPGLGHA